MRKTLIYQDPAGRKATYRWTIRVTTILLFFLLFRPTLFMYNQRLRYYYNLIEVAGLALYICYGVAGIIYKKRVSKYLAVVILWQGVRLFSVALNDMSMAGYFRAAASVLCIFFYIDWAGKKNYSELLKSISFCVIVYAAIDMAMMVSTGELGIFPEMIKSTGTPLYFVNGKFQSSYLQLFLSMVAVLNLEKRVSGLKRFVKYIIYGALIAINIVVTQYVKCTTGTIIVVLFWIAVFIPLIRKTISRPYKFWGLIVALNLLIVVFQVTLSSNMFQSFIENILDKQVTLTGRTDIYSAFSSVMRGHWLLGHGVGNKAILDATGAQNAQNVFLEEITVSGLAGLISLIYILRKTISHKLLSDQNIKAVVFVSGILGFFIAGIVEVCFDDWFYLLVALAFAYQHQLPPRTEQVFN